MSWRSRERWVSQKVAASPDLAQQGLGLGGAAVHHHFTSLET
ncbi:Hypothetical protein (plasmid) [Pseudomonas putida]|nr:Hypothetical protein [Pseudomonas putida]